MKSIQEMPSILTTTLRAYAGDGANRLDMWHVGRNGLRTSRTQNFFQCGSELLFGLLVHSAPGTFKTTIPARKRLTKLHRGL